LNQGILDDHPCPIMKLSELPLSFVMLEDLIILLDALLIDLLHQLIAYLKTLSNSEHWHITNTQEVLYLIEGVL
jgi:hypothetical protein